MLRIGDFSRLARVTVKALRHYDKAGLLQPQFVDPSSGYRHYAPEQLQTLSWIQLLKDLGFPLAEIRRLLAEPTALPAAIQRRREELAGSIAADQARLSRLLSLQRSLEAPAAAPPVKLRSIPPVLALTARDRVRDGSGRITAMFEKVEATAARAKARANGSPFLLIHDGARPDRLDVEVCVPLKAEADALPLARTVPGHARAGSLVFTGPYDRSASLFARLAEWVSENGGAIRGPLREVYVRFGAEQRGYVLPQRVLAREPADYVTELQAPIA